MDRWAGRVTRTLDWATRPLGRVRRASGRAKRQVLTDLREDPYLKFVLLGTLLLAGFWFWHRIPNFATWDEHNRVLDPLVAYSSVLRDPSIEGLRQGVAWGRKPFGATFYVYAIATLPVVLFAAVSGNLAAITGIGFPASTYAHYPVWADTPRWVWTWSLLFVRLTNVVFAVVTVYLLYRLGTAVADRKTGLLAAVLLMFTFGFLMLAKEGGEDVPATMCFLLVLYLLVKYLQTDRRQYLYEASAAGGAAIAFKLTMVPVVALIGIAFLLSARTDQQRWRTALWQPRLLLTGAAIGGIVIVLGHPTALVGYGRDVAEEFGRTGRASLDVGPTAPSWWWFLRTYASALGWPLLVATTSGLLASVGWLARLAPGRENLREDVPGFDERVLVLAGIAGFLLLFGNWHDFRVHHLLPTFPLLAFLLADRLRSVRTSREQAGRVLVAIVVVGAAIYASAGVAMYASMPRDDATRWLAENADDDDTVETYYHGFLENAIPHGMTVNPLWLGTRNESVQRCPEYIQVGYKELLYLQDVPDDQRSYDVDNNVDERARYVRALVDGEYNYTIVAEFGDRPPNFVPDRPDPGSLGDLVPLGVNPHSDQYGDEQELRANQYVAILERTGDCDPDRDPPW